MTTFIITVTVTIPFAFAGALRPRPRCCLRPLVSPPCGKNPGGLSDITVGAHPPRLENLEQRYWQHDRADKDPGTEPPMGGNSPSESRTQNPLGQIPPLKSGLTTAR